MTNRHFTVFLNAMLSELVCCWQRKSPELLRVEAAYMITMKHWNELKSECWQHSFKSTEEEIQFFKVIKPQFTGRIAYYSLLYETLLKLSNDHSDVMSFWESESRRLLSFIQANADFVTHMERGDTKKD